MSDKTDKCIGCDKPRFLSKAPNPLVSGLCGDCVVDILLVEALAHNITFDEFREIIDSILLEQKRVS